MKAIDVPGLRCPSLVVSSCCESVRRLLSATAAKACPPRMPPLVAGGCIHSDVHRPAFETGPLKGLHRCSRGFLLELDEGKTTRPAAAAAGNAERRDPSECRERGVQVAFGGFRGQVSDEESSQFAPPFRAPSPVATASLPPYWRLRYQSLLVAASGGRALGEAVATVNSPIAAGLKRHLGGAAALRADGGVHPSRGCSIAAATAASALHLPGGAAGGTALGLVGEPAAGMVLLVFHGENELGSAVHAGQGFVGVGHSTTSLNLLLLVVECERERRLCTGSSRTGH